jgi:hypothetical protein
VDFYFVSGSQQGTCGFGINARSQDLEPGALGFDLPSHQGGLQQMFPTQL